MRKTISSITLFCLIAVASPVAAEDLIAAYGVATYWYEGHGGSANPAIQVTSWDYGPTANIPTLPIGQPSRIPWVTAGYPGTPSTGLRLYYSDFGASDPYSQGVHPFWPVTIEDFLRTTAIEVTIARRETVQECYPDGFCIPRKHLEFDVRLYAPSIVPEPATLTLFAIGLIMPWRRRR